VDLEDWTTAITTFPAVTAVVVVVVVGFIALFWSPVKDGVRKGIDRFWRRPI
jgi:hypothetical protein